jgi:integrase
MTIEIRPRPRKNPRSYIAVVRFKIDDKNKSQSKTFRIETTAKAAEGAKVAEAEATAWAHAYMTTLKSKITTGNISQNAPGLNIFKLIEHYKTDDDFTELRTKKDIDRLLGWWQENYGTDKVRAFGTIKLREARAKLLNGRSRSTANRYLSAFRKVWNWGITAGMVLEGWPKKLMLKEPRGRIRFLSDEEIVRLLKAAEKDPVIHAAIKVSISTGLRQGELLRLKWQDINFLKQTATIHETKNDERRAVHLNAAAVEALEGLQKAKVRSLVHVFTNVHAQPLSKSLLEGRWRTVRDAAGITDYRWHDHRHTFASNLLQNGAALAAVGKELGHRSPGMTYRYSHLVQGAAIVGHDKLA